MTDYTLTPKEQQKRLAAARVRNFIRLRSLIFHSEWNPLTPRLDPADLARAKAALDEEKRRLLS